MFLSRPTQVLAALWHFLELPGDVSESEALQDAGFFDRHSKYPDESFTIAARRRADQELSPRIREEVERIAEASMALFPEGAHALPLARPLAMVDESQ